MKIPENIYFVGAGGIGMANLVRYFLSKGCRIAGYDRTSTSLTDALKEEGAEIVFDDDPDLIPAHMTNPENTLLVYTPAVGNDNRILNKFRELGFTPVKRAAVLGLITADTDGICIAGSHGKTTTSSMTAWILEQTSGGCNAFLGGILRNTGSNLMISRGSRYSVIEADEYDRSFLQLRPWLAVVTSTDPDHLDIYGDEAGYLDGFANFTSLIRNGGYLIMHTGLKLVPKVSPEVTVETYSGHDNSKRGDWYADNIRWGDGSLTIDIHGPKVSIADISLGVPVEINIDNAVAAAAASWHAGATPQDIKKGLESFKGAERRFHIWLDGVKESKTAVIDDYAHSPAEVKASIESVRKLYPGREIAVIFQPHLYTRTRDFAPEFAEALSSADRLIITEIYPAREKPIEGVCSEMVLKDVKCKNKEYCERKNLLNLIKNSNFEVLMTLGAADLNVLLPEICRI
ncbi:MAG: UDP-N-acetylmuramate--L-alanine ligase, partial [Muribaculaceae bacterium]|nr:UDP-N-acetylmuramate--L-alanine ligase [Muribaculaceae bacterium]